jgi:hypothetical protein
MAAAALHNPPPLPAAHDRDWIVAVTSLQALPFPDDGFVLRFSFSFGGLIQPTPAGETAALPPRFVEDQAAVRWLAVCQGQPVIAHIRRRPKVKSRPRAGVDVSSSGCTADESPERWRGCLAAVEGQGPRAWRVLHGAGMLAADLHRTPDRRAATRHHDDCLDQAFVGQAPVFDGCMAARFCRHPLRNS